MRLTLRTLLAWLDGVLPPDENEAFGQKIAASSSAKILVDRVRGIVAHPGLDAPKVIGKGLAGDANSVAEYLTNTLPADSVAAFERVCIESDAHLAEVAACHRILVQARNDPHLLEPLDSRETTRLLEKIGNPSRSPALDASPAATAHEEHRPAVHQSVHPAHQPSDPQKPVLAIARATPKKAWASMLAALLLVGLLGGALALRLFSGGVGRSGPRDAEPVALRDSRSPQVAATDEVPARKAAANTEPPRDEPRRDSPKRATEANTVAGLDAPKPPTPASPPAAESREKPADGAPAVSQADAPSDGSQPRASRVPGGDALAIAANPARPRDAASRGTEPPAAEGAAVDPEPAKPAPTNPEAPSLAVMGKSPLAFRRAGEAGSPADWEALSSESVITEASDLLVPGGCQPTISLGGGGLPAGAAAAGAATIRLIGPARVVLRPSENAAAEIEVVFGRAVVTGLAAGQPLRFTAAGLSGRVEGAGPIGLEVRFERTPGSEPNPDPRKPSAPDATTAIGTVFFPVGGRIELDPAIAGTIRPEAGGLIRGDGTVATGVAISARGPIGLPPPSDGGTRAAPSVDSSVHGADWLGAPQTPGLLDRMAAESMVAALASDPTPAALERLLADSRLENRSAAAATLALMGLYGPLVEVLAAEEPGTMLPEKAWESLESAMVPLALARGPASAGRLLAAFAEVGPPADPAVLRKLVLGFSDDALAAGGDAELVTALDHPSLLVRRLAATRLVETVRPAPSDRFRYRPDGPPDARAEAVKWWRAQLEKGRIRRGAGGGLSKPQRE